MVTEAGRIKVNTEVDFKGLKRQLQKVENTTARTSKRIDTNLSKAFNGMVKIAQRAAIGFGVAMAGITASSLKAASDAEEIRAKFETVFKETTKDADKFAVNLGKSVGRATQDIRKWMAELQDLFVPLGFGRRAALELDKELVKLSIDVASFNNKLDDNVLRDFKSALVGNHETVRKYGIFISEASLTQEAFNQGMNKTFRQLTDQEKVMLRMKLIIKGSSDAMGDAVRTGNSFANQMKRMRGNITNVREELGKKFLPKFNEIVTRVNKFIEENPKKVDEWANAFSSGVEKTINAGGKLIEKLGGIEGTFKAVKTVALLLSGVLITKLVASIISTIISLKAYIGKSIQVIASLTAETAAVTNAAGAWSGYGKAVLAANASRTAKGLAPYSSLSIGGKPVGAPASIGAVSIFRKLGRVVGKILIPLKAIGAKLLTLTGALTSTAAVLAAFTLFKANQFRKKVNKINKFSAPTQKEISQAVAQEGKAADFDKSVTTVKGSERFAATKQLQHEFGRKQKRAAMEVEKGLITEEQYQKKILELEKQKVKAKQELHKKFGVGKFSPEKIAERMKARQEEQAKRDAERLAHEKKITAERIRQAKMIGLERIASAISETEGRIGVGSSLLGATQSVSQRVYGGFKASGEAVSMTGQQLFGKGEKQLSKDAQAITDRIKWLGGILQSQNKERQRLENIDTGAVNSVSTTSPL